MTVTVRIRYTIDPHRKSEVDAYFARWAEIVPRLGGGLHGYWTPHEGDTGLGLGLISYRSLAHYEEYRRALFADAEARDAFAFAADRRIIAREERVFLRPASGHAPRDATGAAWPAAADS